MGFLSAYQLSIMLYLSGACGVLACMTLLIPFASRGRKSILTLMEVSAMLLLLFDRLSYLVRGDVSDTGYYLVRVSNGLVFFLSLFIPHLVTQYLKDVTRNEGGLTEVPLWLRACDGLFLTGTVLLVISQFTGLYYTFDDLNNYQRAGGFPLAYVMPILMVVLQELTILRTRKSLRRGMVVSLMGSISLPTLAAVVQIFCYGLSLASMTMGVLVILFYIYAMGDMARTVSQAKENELRASRQAEQREAAMFRQTAQALAEAIDAKDRYTHGHSTRVADFSRQIAQRAGFSQKDCDQVYFSALLHDVGKIGVKDEIINKAGRLTDEEFAQIRLHPILGYHILSNIRQAPSLSVGAHYHHERYDGTGYPDGLRGEDIPEIARIIAVADAYDAMSSNRSYRAHLSPERTRAELEKGMGTQFDPRFARILLDLLEEGERAG